MRGRHAGSGRSRGRGSRRPLFAAAALAAVLAAVVAAAPLRLLRALRGGGGQFSDVAGADQTEAVAALAEHGLLDGTLCGADSFCPDDGITRAHMAIWLVRALDGEDPAPVTETRFADVDPTSPHAAFVERLAQLGITKGCKSRPLSYCGDDTVTRGQMASFFVRALKLTNAPAAAFTDVDRRSVHAYSIAVLSAAGYMGGCTPTEFCPDAPATRSQAAAVLTQAPGLTTSPQPADSDGDDTADTNDSTASNVCALADDNTLTCTLGTTPYTPTPPAQPTTPPTPRHPADTKHPADTNRGTRLHATLSAGG